MAHFLKFHEKLGSIIVDSIVEDLLSVSEFGRREEALVEERLKRGKVVEKEEAGETVEERRRVAYGAAEEKSVGNGKLCWKLKQSGL